MGCVGSMTVCRREGQLRVQVLISARVGLWGPLAQAKACLSGMNV